MPEAPGPQLDRQRKRRAKYRRARIRNLLFTVAPGRLTKGSITRKHLARAVEVHEVEIWSPRWPAAFDGLRIGHVSDFHLGELITLERALEAVDLLAASEPDLVACTGDVVDLHHGEAPRLFDALVGVDAPLGAVLVLGNHDELHAPRTLARRARAAGIRVLEDDRVEIERDGHALTMAGIGWASSAPACAERVDRVGEGPPDLLLAHNPRAFPRAAELGIALTLSGHTHGGQIAVRNRSNANLALAHRHRAGLYEDGASRLFVTTGVGAWFPLRVNCPAEVAMLTVRRGDGPSSSATRRPRGARVRTD